MGVWSDIPRRSLAVAIGLALRQDYLTANEFALP